MPSLMVSYTGDSSGLNFKLALYGTSLALADHGRVFDSSHSDNPSCYYMPSLMVNCPGDMVAGFSGSTATNYMSALYCWRLSSGVTSVPTNFWTGTFKTSPRAGDYSATTLDPIDDWSFWTVQQYGTNNGALVSWGTAVTRIRPNP
jgi:hypothetical protein